MNEIPLIWINPVAKNELLIKKHGSFVCPENWKCTEWGICINDAQKRVCVDMNSCATEKDKPNLEKECEIITNSSGSSLFNFEEECIDYALPDCGTSFLDVVPLYEEDCGLVCFGKNLLENCEETNLTFTYEDGSKEVFQSLGSDSENCFLKHEILIESPDFPGSQGVYLECPISLDSILDLSCYNDECSVLGMPGQTTFNMLSFMWEDAFYNPDTLCSGSMIAYYENFGS